MAQLAIKGHPTRGKEIIEILEMLGGKNKYVCQGLRADRIYLIHDFSGNIEDMLSTYEQLPDYQVYTLERFLEKFPYKVGDKVRVCGDNLGVIVGMRWETGYVVYKVKLSKNGYETSKTSENLQPYEETPLYLNEKANKQAEEIAEILEPAKEIMEGVYAYNEINCYHQDFGDKVRIRLGNDFEIKVEDKITYIVKKQPQYPKNYDECCKVLLLKPERATYSVSGLEYERHLIVNLQRLLICRNAYWKIAGEQLGLDKPWEYDMSKNEFVYAIAYQYGHIQTCEIRYRNRLLTFPTIEMRDDFYKNFKELIELCKELL